MGSNTDKWAPGNEWTACEQLVRLDAQSVPTANTPNSSRGGGSWRHVHLVANVVQLVDSKRKRCRQSEVCTMVYANI